MFPSIIYPIFGVSKELSIGPFALISLALAQAVRNIHPEYHGLTETDPVQAQRIAVPVHMGITFIVGVYLVALGTFRLGWLVSFFSDPTLAAFTCACAYVIVCSQVAAICGLQIPPDSLFSNIWENIVANIHTFSLPTFIVGASCIAVLFLFNKAFVRFHLHPGAPLLVVILSTFLSYQLDFSGKWGIRTVGAMWNSFPGIKVPSVPSLQAYAIEAVPVAITTLIITISVSAHMANAHNEAIDNNQEVRL